MNEHNIVSRVAQLGDVTDLAKLPLESLRRLVEDAKVVLTTNPAPLYWFTVMIVRQPTNFNEPFLVAIQATDRNAADERRRKLYSTNLYSTWYDMSDKPADPDEITNARKHPLTGSAS